MPGFRPSPSCGRRAFLRIDQFHRADGLIWHIAAQGGSAGTITLASMAGFLPLALIGPFAGVIVDRHPINGHPYRFGPVHRRHQSCRGHGGPARTRTGVADHGIAVPAGDWLVPAYAGVQRAHPDGGPGGAAWPAVRHRPIACNRSATSPVPRWPPSCIRYSGLGVMALIDVVGALVASLAVWMTRLTTYVRPVSTTRRTPRACPWRSDACSRRPGMASVYSGRTAVCSLC